MITDLEFFFIQAHEHTIIEPSEGVTVIKGPSHTAKSSLIRGLQWLFLNKRTRGLKSNFVGDDTQYSVGVNFKEGSFINRRRDKTANAYDIPTDTLDPVGTDLPQEVKDITKMSEINIQAQHDGYFMLNESSGHVGRELNKLVGLDIINVSFKKCDQIITKATTDSAYNEQSIKQAETNLERFKPIDKIETQINEVGKLITEHEDLNNKTENLSLLIKGVIEEQTTLDTLNDFLTIVPKFNEVSEMIIDYNIKKVEAEKLSVLVNEIKEEQETLSSLNEWLEVVPLYEEINVLINQYKMDASLNETLKKLCETIDQEHYTLKTAHHELLESKNNYDLFIKNNPVCPLCGAKMKGG